jgi:hypothetical protein
MGRTPYNAFALALLSIISCELLAADDNAEHAAIRAKFTGCVETKAIEYSKSTESADLVFEIAVNACKTEMSEAASEIFAGFLLCYSTRCISRLCRAMNKTRDKLLST